MTKCKINPVAAGLAVGVLWGLSILLLGLLVHLGVEGGLVVALRTHHAMTEVAMPGLFVAVFFAVVDGFIRGAILAFLYNLFNCWCGNKDGSCA